MTTPHAPAVAHLLLDAYLRDLFTVHHERGAAARFLGHGTIWITRPDRQPPPSPDQLGELLPLLGVQDPAVIRSTQQLLAPSPSPYQLLDTAPGWYDRLAACERMARSLRMCAPAAVPAVLQTPAYTAALATAPLRPTAIERCPARSRLLPAARTRRLTVVVNDAVLAAETGGPAVMAEQIAHLQQEALGERAEIRVRSPSSGAIGQPACEIAFPGHRHRVFVSEEGYPLYVSGPLATASLTRQALNAALDDAASANASQAVLQHYRQIHEQRRLLQMLPKPS
ncbi:MULTISPECIES: Scr1 family TA system antitoxin-like transcriptional regulator [Streptomyces]|uniref:Scr1 family TA system antitoxin-like transcriptional regulator n=1 Tax=Streptomyces TaxID=1883 RepID=UPI0004CD3CE3|nr:MULTISPECIES: Scr1 family TA system antitoxin-like transcriptional regulator [Streptomyces]KOT52694.1 hypothetical protein ADK43_29975 [Streptomyces rimosus subsp. rimosus]